MVCGSGSESTVTRPLPRLPLASTVTCPLAGGAKERMRMSSRCVCRAARGPASGRAAEGSAPAATNREAAQASTRSGARRRASEGMKRTCLLLNMRGKTCRLVFRTRARERLTPAGGRGKGGKGEGEKAKRRKKFFPFFPLPLLTFFPLALFAEPPAVLVG